MSMSAARNSAGVLVLSLLAACAGPRPAIPPEAHVEPPQGWRTTIEAPGAELSAAWWNRFGSQPHRGSRAGRQR
jgi:hypothetical protein